VVFLFFNTNALRWVGARKADMAEYV